MKKVTSLISFCFIGLLLTSCAVRGGYHSGSERYSYSSSYSSFASNVEKTSSSSKSSSNSIIAQNTNTTSKSGFFVGIYFTDISLGDKFELQPEIDFVAIKDLNQIQAPILAKYNLADKMDILAGPNLGFLLDAPTGLKSFNVGVDIGAAYDIAEKININARYGFGLSNLLENPGGSSSKLSGFQIGLGYKF